MAYDGWLVGHARWFPSAAGRKLLDCLRSRAAGARKHEKPSYELELRSPTYLAGHWLELAGVVTAASESG